MPKESVKDLRSRLEVVTRETFEAIEAGRAAIAGKRQELHRAQDAPIPLPEVDARIRAHVEDVGARWLSDRGASLVMGERGLATANARGLQLPWLPSEAMPWAAACAADPERAAALLSALVKRVPYEAGPPTADRPAHVTRLDAELRELEVADERRTEEARAAGLAVDHRPDVTERKEREAAEARREAELAEARRARMDAIDREHEATV